MVFIVSRAFLRLAADIICGLGVVCTQVPSGRSSNDIGREKGAGAQLPRSEGYPGNDTGEAVIVKSLINGMKIGEKKQG